MSKKLGSLESKLKRLGLDIFLIFWHLSHFRAISLWKKQGPFHPWSFWWGLKGWLYSIWSSEVASWERMGGWKFWFWLSPQIWGEKGNVLCPMQKFSIKKTEKSSRCLVSVTSMNTCMGSVIICVPVRISVYLWTYISKNLGEVNSVINLSISLHESLKFRHIRVFL